jgi:hypothetical protein
MKTIGDNTLQPEFDPFNTPIPGQSLTDEPGNYPWEHPPRKTDPEVILFMEGEFTPDLGFTLAEAVMEMITAIGMRAGIENLKISLEDVGNKEFKHNMVKLKQAKENKEMETMGLEKPTIENKPKTKGLLAKPEENK